MTHRDRAGDPLGRREGVSWTYLFGWQRVALGLLIVVIVVFFPVGIMGWLRERWPEKFGERVDVEARAAPVSLGESR